MKRKEKLSVHDCVVILVSLLLVFETLYYSFGSNVSTCDYIEGGYKQGTPIYMDDDLFKCSFFLFSASTSW